MFFCALLLALLILPGDVRSTGGVDGGTTPNGVGPEGYGVAVRGEGDITVRSFGGYNLSCPAGMPESPPVYLAVGPESFMGETMRLLGWKWLKGTPAYYLTLEEVENRSVGRDTGERLHNALKEIKNSAPTLRYLLLVGDSEVIPPRKLYTWAATAGYPYDDYYYSDVYWAGLDSSWDDDGDGRYGEYNFSTGEVEGDFDFDLYVGRFPVNTPGEVRTMVGRLLTYEREPRIGNWMRRVIIWASLMDPPNQLDPSSPYYYEPWRDNAYKVGEKVRALLPPHMLNMTLYDYPFIEGGNYTPQVDQLNRQNMLQQFNSGATIVNFIGQARYNGNALNDYADPTGLRFIWNEPFGYFDYNTLLNGDMLPLMYASTCDAAKFWETDDTNLERLVTTSQGGLLALISSTGTSARLETQTDSFGNWWLDEQFMRIILYETMRPGEALYTLKERYVREKMAGHPTQLILVNLYGYVLLGDPEVEIWRDIPVFASLQAPPLYAGEGHYTFRVTDATGKGVEGVRVVLYSDQYYRVFTTGGGGYANVTLNLTEGWALNYTLCGGVVYPASGNLTVGGKRADLAVRFEVSKSEITLKVLNIGEEVAEGVVVTVSREVGGTFTLLKTFEVGSVVPGGLWEMPLRESLSLEGGPVHLKAEASMEGEEVTLTNNVAEVSCYLTHPVLVLSFYSARPSTVVPPGAELRLIWQIRNSGNYTARNVSYILYLGNPEQGGISILEGVFEGTIPPMQIEYITTTFSPPQSGEYYLQVDPERRYYQPSRASELASVWLEVNRPPEFKAEAPRELYMDEDTTLTVDLLEWVTDPDNSTIDLRITVSTDRPDAVQLRGRELEIAPPENWWGVLRVVVNVTDGVSYVNRTVTVHVREVNDPPAPVHSVVTVEVVEDEPFCFHLEAEDVDGDSFTFLGEGDFFVVHPNGTVEGVARQEDVGIHSFTVTITDARGGGTEMELVIEVIEVNDPPVVEPVEDRTVKVGQKVVVQLSARDEEGAELTFRSLTPGVQVDPKTGWLTFTPGPEDVGTVTVRVSVTDGENYSYIIFNVTVLPGEGKENGGGSRGIYVAVGMAGALAVLIATLILRRKRGGGLPP